MGKALCLFVVNSHLELFDKNLKAHNSVISNLTFNLQHQHSISSLCML